MLAENVSRDTAKQAPRESIIPLRQPKQYEKSGLPSETLETQQGVTCNFATVFYFHQECQYEKSSLPS